MLKEKILEQLKTKYKSLGLSAKILEGFATRLAKTVTEENKIEEAVNDVEYELQIWQSVLDANRKEVSDLKKQLAESKKTDSQKEEPTDNQKPVSIPNEETKDDTPAWAKALMSEVQALKIEKVHNSRRAAYEAQLKDIKDEKVRSEALSDYDAMTFKDDEEHNSFLERKSTYWNQFNQNQIAESLKTGRPIVGSQNINGGVSPMMDAYLKEEAKKNNTQN